MINRIQTSCNIIVPHVELSQDEEDDCEDEGGEDDQWTNGEDDCQDPNYVQEYLNNIQD